MSSDQKGHGVNAGVIVGLIIAILILIGGSATAYVFLRRRRQRSQGKYIIFSTPGASPTNEKKLDLIDDVIEFRPARRRPGSDL